MVTRRDILERLVIDEDAIFETLVDKASKVFKIDRNGRTIFLMSKSKLTDRQRIAMVLLARYFAQELGFAESDIMRNSEIAEAVGVEANVTAARLSELRKEGVVLSEATGKWRVSIIDIGKVLEEMGTD